MRSHTEKARFFFFFCKQKQVKKTHESSEAVPDQKGVEEGGTKLYSGGVTRENPQNKEGASGKREREAKKKKTFRHQQKTSQRSSSVACNQKKTVPLALGRGASLSLPSLLIPVSTRRQAGVHIPTDVRAAGQGRPVHPVAGECSAPLHAAALNASTQGWPSPGGGPQSPPHYVSGKGELRTLRVKYASPQNRYEEVREEPAGWCQ